MTHLIDLAATSTVRREVDALRTWAQTRETGLNVALIYGGLSAEDRLYIAECPTDLMSLTALSESLTAIGATFKILDPCDPGFIADLLNYDVALPNLHGPYGEDGRLQGLADYLRIPICGSGVAASAIAADKILCKQWMTGMGVPTPAWTVWTKGAPAPWSGSPVMVKPAMGGSSVGMSLVETQAELQPALDLAWDTDASPVLVEDFITGVPVTVGLLQLPGGLLAFPPLAVKVHASDFYDEATKLNADAQGHADVITADLPPHVLQTLTRHALTVWNGLDCRGAARIDFMVTDDGQVSALEVNTTPGLARDANYVIGANQCGLSHADIVAAVVHEALARPPYDVPLPTPAFHTGAAVVREPVA